MELDKDLFKNELEQLGSTTTNNGPAWLNTVNSGMNVIEQTFSLFRKPKAIPSAPPPPDNTLLYIGGGAIALVGIYLLTQK